MALGILFLAGSLQAQDRPRGGGQGNFDPAQFMDRMMDNYQERLEFSDEEWKAIRPMVEDIMAKQRDARSGGRGMFGGFGGFGRGGDRGDRGADRGGDRGDRGGRARRGGFGEPNPQAEALESAVEANAADAELKAKLEAYRKDRKAKEEALTKAQDKFRKVLTIEQECKATLMGLVE